MIVNTISEQICGTKGVLNVGGWLRSNDIGIIEQHSTSADFTCQVLSLTSTKETYSTVILDHDMFDFPFKEVVISSQNQATTVQTRSVGKFCEGNFDYVGVNFREGIDNLQNLLEAKWDLNFDIISFKASTKLLAEGQSNVDLSNIASHIKQAHSEIDDLIYIIELSIEREESQLLPRTAIDSVSKQLYITISDLVVTHELPIERVILTLNLSSLFAAKNQKNPASMESAFDALMLLAHSLPSSIGGILFTFDGLKVSSLFPSFLLSISKMKVINYFPTSFQVNASTISSAIAEKINPQQRLHPIIKSTEFSLDLLAGLSGTYKPEDKPQPVKGNIIIGSLH